MATNIEWTSETWNPLVGCTKVSAGCKHCYAETMGKRLRAMALADIAAGKDPGRKRAYIDAVDERGRWTGRVVTLPEALSDPLGWRKPRRVFVNSMSDLFHESVPFEFIAAVFGVMAACPQHTFQVLTKQPGRAVEFFQWLRSCPMPHSGLPDYPDHVRERSICCRHAWMLPEAIVPRSAPVCGLHPSDDVLGYQRGLWPLPNAWLLTSVEDQPSADARIPHLLACPAAVHGVSYEPALGPVDFTRIRNGGVVRCALSGGVWSRGPSGDGHLHALGMRRLGWVIVGGESGPAARPFHPEWALSVVRQCREAGVACFVKQMGSAPVLSEGEPPFRDKKGGDPAEWPEDLRVREFPQP